MKLVIITGSAPSGDLSGIFPAAAVEWVQLKEVSQLSAHPDADGYIDLDFTTGPTGIDSLRVETLSRMLPAPVFAHAMIPTLSEIGRPFIRINAWPGCLEREVHELVVPKGDAVQRITTLYSQLGKSYRLAPDIPGMISGRILATLVNEAYHTLGEEVSTRQEIDTAMKLGTNYPWGPFEWSERIGLKNIADLLEVLGRTDRRYEPARALQETLKMHVSGSGGGIRKD